MRSLIEVFKNNYHFCFSMVYMHSNYNGFFYQRARQCNHSESRDCYYDILSPFFNINRFKVMHID